MHWYFYRGPTGFGTVPGMGTATMVNMKRGLKKCCETMCERNPCQFGDPGKEHLSSMTNKDSLIKYVPSAEMPPFP